MYVSWPVPRGNGNDAALPGDGIWDHLQMEELPTKVYLFRKNHQHSKTLYVTFTQEFTNIIGLLHQVEEILTQKISYVNIDKDSQCSYHLDLSSLARCMSHGQSQEVIAVMLLFQAMEYETTSKWTNSLQRFTFSGRTVNTQRLCMWCLLRNLQT